MIITWRQSSLREEASGKPKKKQEKAPGKTEMFGRDVLG